MAIDVSSKTQLVQGGTRLLGVRIETARERGTQLSRAEAKITYRSRVVASGTSTLCVLVVVLTLISRFREGNG